MKFQIEAAKRLAETIQVEAADAADAGKALRMLEDILGKSTKGKEKYGYESVNWKTKTFDATLSLPSWANGEEFYFEIKIEYKGGLYCFDAGGDTFEKFKKSFQKEIELLLKTIDSDLKEMEKQAKEMKEIHQFFNV